MKSSIRLGKILGIKIGVHYSWFVVLALLTWSLAQGFLPDQYPGWSPSIYWVVALVCAVLLFVSVLVHELAHSVIAKMRGFPVEGITLFILGGVSYLKAEAGRAIDELAIAGAGPATSFVISAFCFLCMFAVSDDTSQLHALFRYLAIANLAIGLFNLIPAFPLDGGRVLRSLIWAGTGKLTTATNIATACGQIVGMVLLAGGVYIALTGYILQGLWLIMGGWFLQSGATATRKDMAFENLLKNVRVFDVMDQQPKTVEPGAMISQVVQDHMMHRGVRALPVVADDKLIGLISLSDIKKVPQDQWPSLNVGQKMTPAPLLTVGPSDSLVKAVDTMGEKSVHQLPVMVGERLVGMLTRAHVIQYLQKKGQIKQDRSNRTPR